MQELQTICPWCNQLTEIIWIHGQCGLCGVNIDECCRGEQCNNLTKAECDEEENTDQAYLF